MRTVLVTGGAGFIGSNFIQYLIGNTDYSVINFDALTYAGNLENLDKVSEDKRYSFIRGDITDPDNLSVLLDLEFDYLVNFAAESHVDRSILKPDPFISTNVAGTLNLLNIALEKEITLFVQISTDEVYGSLASEGRFREDSPLNPSSPYSASKAAADLIAYSCFRTYDLPIIITRCSNNYGPYQFPEKLIPLALNNARNNTKIPLYGDGLQIRDWIHVEDHCRGILTVLEKGSPGRIYNLGGNSERKNLDVVAGILDLMGKSHNLISFVPDRKAHDRRYSVDFSRIQSELDWQPRMNFETGLELTVAWYLNNISWLDNVVSGEYRSYYEKVYGKFYNGDLNGSI